MNDDIRAEDRARIEAEFKASMSPRERAMVEEFDELEALRHAGRLPPEKETHWFLLSRAMDGIWGTALMRKLMR